MPPKQSKPDDSKTRILIVDDHPLMRDGVRQRINRESDLAVCAEAATAAEALEAIPKQNPDMIIVDVAMVGKNGIELVKDLKVRHPRLPVIVLSVYDESLYAERALWAGARGYVMKQENADVLVQAIRRVRSGQVFVTERVSAKILNRVAGGGGDEIASPIDELSDRELEVFRLVGDGYGAHEIAARLHLSTKTVATHTEHIKRKLSLSSTRALARFAIHWARGDRPQPVKTRT
ncbi:MAG TPA: response regulator transcription factor [Verrucomicrobiae bacterium]|nr:response regulator transcription factor [Verrucomicrobiae bacterium]